MHAGGDARLAHREAARAQGVELRHRPHTPARATRSLVVEARRSITTGTAETETRHRLPATFAGLIVSVAPPVFLAIVGIALMGFDAIRWGVAVVAGVIPRSRSPSPPRSR